MTSKDEPIYPIVHDREGVPPIIEFQGLTKREYFAAMAMQGILASQHNVHFVNESIFAAQSVRQADALISALNQEAK